MPELKRQPFDPDTATAHVIERQSSMQPRVDTAASGEAAEPEEPEERLDEEEVLRALERNLVRQGGLVLPAGSYEIEPQLAYSYRGLEGVQIVDQGNESSVAFATERHERMESTVSWRAGLPSDFQFDLRVPFGQERLERVIAGVEASRSESGLGDIAIGITRQLWRDASGRSGLLGTVSISLPTSDEDQVSSVIASARPSISIGSGFRTVQGTVTGVWRQDPVVFFGSWSYGVSSSEELAVGRIEPGNFIGIKLGGFLAVSPDISVRLAAEAVNVEETQLDGQELTHSDQVIARLELGVSTALLPRTLIDIAGTIGVTDDAPDFQLQVSVPIRF